MRRGSGSTAAGAALLILAVAMAPSRADAQSCSATAPDPLCKWFEKYGISIRKTFDGSKEEQSPASISGVDEAKPSGRRFWTVDVAAKVSGREFHPTTQSTLEIYPTGEYHQSTKDSTSTNRGSAGLRADFQPYAVRPFGASGAGLPIGFVVSGNAKIARNFVSRSNETTWSATLAPYGATRGMPGASLRRASGAFLGRYYLYGGIERYEYNNVPKDSAGTFVMGRAWSEWWLVATSTHEYVQFTTDFAWRSRTSGTLSPKRQTADVSLGLTWYLDGLQHVGIGVDYARGNEAGQHFTFRERTTVGLKIKF